MRRAGVVLLTTSATACLDDVLNEIAPEDAPVMAGSCARAATSFGGGA